MGDWDDRRVEARTVLVGMGMGVTPEKVRELEDRARRAERQNRPPPQQAFSAVLKQRAGELPASPPSAKEQKHAALPKKGPRPQLSHPAQRESFGRETADEAAVIIKA